MCIKVAYNVVDGHISQGRGSHACMLRTTKEWDDNVRALVWPERKAVYFRFYAPKWDGLGNPTEDDYHKAFQAASEALNVFIKHGIVKKSWRVFYWQTGKNITDVDVRL